MFFNTVFHGNQPPLLVDLSDQRSELTTFPSLVWTLTDQTAGRLSGGGVGKANSLDISSE